MINYNKNKLINKTLDKYYETFSHTLDTADYVPEQYNMKICKYIFVNLKRSFRQINKEDRLYQSGIRKNAKNKQKLAKKQEKILKRQERKKLKEQKPMRERRNIFRVFRMLFHKNHTTDSNTS